VQETMRVLREMQRNGKINPNKIGRYCFSAGGPVAQPYELILMIKVYDPIPTSAMPDFSCLVIP